MKVTNDHTHAANRGEVQASKVLQEMKKRVLVAIAEYHSSILASGICTTMQTLDDLPRTNNAVKGWHCSFQANVGAYHPNFWKFIDILKCEQNLTQVKIVQARAGHQPEPQRRHYQDSNQRIKNIVQDYHNCDIMQYLCGLAHNTSHVSALCQPKRFFQKPSTYQRLYW